MIHSWADGKGGQKIEDTGPLTRERMPTIDQEIYGAAVKFIDKAASDKKPFFVWFNTTRMHVWTHLKKESEGKTGIGLYPDGMVEHDAMVGDLLKKLDDLKLSENTILVYGTDNGAEASDLARWRHHALPRGEGNDVGRRIPRAHARALARRHEAGHSQQSDFLPRGLDANSAGGCRRS